MPRLLGSYPKGGSIMNYDNKHDEQGERIAENAKHIDWENMDLQEIEDIFEDRDPFEFL